MEKLRVHLKLPPAAQQRTERMLQRVAEQCPVKRSLDLSIHQELIWS